MPGFLFFVRFFFLWPCLWLLCSDSSCLLWSKGEACFALLSQPPCLSSHQRDEAWTEVWKFKAFLKQTCSVCLSSNHLPGQGWTNGSVYVARRAGRREPVCLASLYACLLDLDYYFCLKQPIKWMLITASNGTCQSLALVLLPCLNNSARRHNESILLLDFQHDYCPSQPPLLSFKSFHAKVKTHTLNS